MVTGPRFPAMGSRGLRRFSAAGRSRRVDGVVTLYRAEVEEGGHFARCSHWTPTRWYAEYHFAHGAQRLKTDPRPLVLWAVEVDIPSPVVYDLRLGEEIHYVSFDNQARAGSYSIEGAEWVIAKVTDMDGAVFESAIYLGDTPLRPARL